MKNLIPMALAWAVFLLGPSLLQAQTFTRVEAGDVGTNITVSTGASWGDFNGDGWPDLFVANSSSTISQRNELFLNNGDGSFSRVIEGAVAQSAGTSFSASWIDFDNDGWLDLYVSNWGLVEGGTLFPERNALFRNNGDGTFARIDEGDLATNRNPTWSTSWADYDKDGDLDLFLGSGSGNQAQNQNYLYRNDDGVFTSLADVPMAQAGNNTLGAHWVDYDEDGDEDLFMVNFSFVANQNELYRNLLSETGTPAFEAVTDLTFLTDADDLPMIGSNWIDIDNDDDLDVFVITSFLGTKNLLYRNDGLGLFNKVGGNDVLVSETGSYVGSCWGDYDNDGDLDVFLASNDAPAFADFNRYYRNQGQGNFEKVETGPLVEGTTFSNGCGHADYDNDGDLDLFVARGADLGNCTTTSCDFVPLANDLYRNDDGNQNNWINLTLRGTQSNTFGVGAIVRATATLDGQARTQRRTVTGGATGPQSQSDTRVHFGLADATVIDELVIAWPSGLIDTFADVPVNQFLIAREGQTLTAIANEPEATLPRQIALDQNYPNPFNPATTIRYRLSNPSSVRLRVFDVLGRVVATLAEGTHAAGTFEVSFSGEGLPSGLYLYRLEAGTVVETRKMVLQK